MTVDRAGTFDQLCFGCSGLMFKSGLAGAGGEVRRDQDNQVTLESDDMDLFVVCPHCGPDCVIRYAQSTAALDFLAHSRLG